MPVFSRSLDLDPTQARRLGRAESQDRGASAKSDDSSRRDESIRFSTDIGNRPRLDESPAARPKSRLLARLGINNETDTGCRGSSVASLVRPFIFAPIYGRVLNASDVYDCDRAVLGWETNLSRARTLRSFEIERSSRSERLEVERTERECSMGRGVLESPCGSRRIMP